MKFYADCFHGVGHGIVLAYIISKMGVTYGVNEQFYLVDGLKAEDYDATMSLCGLFGVEEAAGCADGVSHSFFNYMTEEQWPRDWLWYCAKRPWPAYCYRNVFEYAPLSLFGIQKNGSSTRLEWLTVVGVKVPTFSKVTTRLREMCLELPAEVQASCIYGIVTSDWKHYVATNVASFSGARSGNYVPSFVVNPSTVMAFCNVEGIQKNVRVLDTCLLPVYDITRKTQKGSRYPPCVATFGKYGAKCRVEADDVVVWGAKKFPAWACDRVLCPYRLGPTHALTANESIGTVQHRLDGH